MYILKNSTPEQKAKEGALQFSGKQKQGAITNKSRELGFSRQTLYRWADQTGKVLKAHFDGSSAEEQTLELERTVLTLYANAHASLEGIQRCLSEILKVDVSIGRLSQIINCAADRALAHMPLMVPAQPCDVALDEIFGRTPKQAYLNMVDVHSFTVLASSGPHLLDSETWELVLTDFEERGGEVGVTISDGGSSILAAVADFYPDRLHRRDNWHIFHAVGKLRRKLDAKGKKSPTTNLGESIDYLLSELRDLIQVTVVRGGRLLSLSERLNEIGEVFKLWLELEAAQVGPRKDILEQMRAKFNGIYDEQTAFAVDLEAEQEAVRTFVGEEALALMGWAWQRREHLDGCEGIIQGLHQNLKPSAEGLFWKWNHAVRASSAVENWHSILRPHLAVHRRLSPAQLALLAVCHNYTVFSRGEHKGKSPLQLSGVIDQPMDWLTALGYGPASQPELKSVRRAS